MIDINWLDEQLDLALTEDVRSNVKALTPSPPLDPGPAEPPPPYRTAKIGAAVPVWTPEPEWGPAPMKTAPVATPEPTKPEPVPVPVDARPALEKPLAPPSSAAPIPAPAPPAPAAPAPAAARARRSARAGKPAAEPAPRRPAWTLATFEEHDLPEPPRRPSRRRSPALTAAAAAMAAAPVPTSRPVQASENRPSPGRPAAGRLLLAAAANTSSAPAHSSASQSDSPDRPVAELLRLGRLDEADVHIAAQSLLARVRGNPSDRLQAATWATMRALLDGRQNDARSNLDRTLTLAGEASDGVALERYWLQRYWIALEWGDEDEAGELLDHCRERAYRFDDLSWRAALSLLLARLGRTEEAAREFDATAARTLDASSRDGAWLDTATTLAEAAAVLGDAPRAAQTLRALGKSTAPVVVAGPGAVCKGSMARFRALLAATTGKTREADEQFRVAVDTHRRLGAQPLLARTLNEWSRSLAGRDDLRARECFQESSELARRLKLAGLVVEERAS